MAVVQTPGATFSLTVRGRRGPPPTRPDPIVVVGKDGRSRFRCPLCGASLVLRHRGLWGRAFYGCSRWPNCSYCLGNERARLVKHAVRDALLSIAKNREKERGRLPTLSVGTTNA